MNFRNFLEKQNRIQLRVEGKNLERFIKRLIAHKISLLKMRQIDRKTLLITIYEKDYEKLKELKTIYRISIIDTYGVNRFKKKWKKNRALLLSIFLGLAVLIVLSNLIYQVEIVYLDKDVRNFLKRELEKEGIHRYQWKKSYQELEQIKKKIIKNNQDKIEWMEIETVGTKYVVRVEMRKLPEKKKETQIRHIVAKKDAIVRRVEASQGEIIRKNNDYVKAGDIIISGEIKLNEEIKNKVSAKGKVFGEVWYEVEVEIPYHYYHVKKTGRTNTVYTIEYFNHRFELLNAKPFRQKECKVNKIWEHFVLPIRFQKEKQTEVIKTDKILKKNEAIQQAVELGIDKMQEKLTKKEKIIDVKTLKTTQKFCFMVVDMFFTVYEDITAYGEVKETEEENNVENAQE